MENTIQFQAEKVLDDDPLFLASSIVLSANRTVRDVQNIVAALLRYAVIGVSITDSLMDLMVSPLPEER